MWNMWNKSRDMVKKKKNLNDNVFSSSKKFYEARKLTALQY